MKIKHALSAAALAAGALCSGQALADIINLTLENPTPGAYQQTTNSPCVIGGSSCPNTFPYTTISTPNDYALSSPVYDVSTIRNLLGGLNGFSIGIDVNTAGVTNGYATEYLEYFYAVVTGLKNGTQSSDTFLYNGPTQLAVSTVAAGNGNGYADDLLSGFNLTGWANDATIQFYASVSNASDGTEQFFITNPSDPGGGGNGNPVPEPATLAMLGLGILGLAWSAKRAEG